MQCGHGFTLCMGLSKLKQQVGGWETTEYFTSSTGNKNIDYFSLFVPPMSKSPLFMSFINNVSGDKLVVSSENYGWA